MACELTNEHKYAILKRFYASPDFSLDEKKALKAKTFENDDSDAGKNCAKVCEWSLPEEALKEKLWAEITDANTKDSLMDSRMKIQGFWQRKMQPKIVEPYIEKYYAIVASVIETRDREFAEVFMQSMSPAYMGRDSDKKTFEELLEKANSEKDFYVRFLKAEIENIDTT